MVTRTEQVWRHLLAGVYAHDQRQWPSITMLAHDLDMPISTTHRALGRPGQIGAVDVSRADGIVVRGPGTLLILWAGARQFHRDIADRFQVPALAREVEAAATSPTTVLGRFGAIAAHQHGNRVADYTTVVFYGDPGLTLGRCAEPRWPWEATEVLVVDPDPLLARYGRIPPRAQAWVDLFNLGGWQADRFVHHLADEMIHDGAHTVLPA